MRGRLNQVHFASWWHQIKCFIKLCTTSFVYVCVCVCMYALVFQSLSVWSDLKCFTFSLCLSEGIWSVSVTVCLKGFKVFLSLSVWRDLKCFSLCLSEGIWSVSVTVWRDLRCFSHCLSEGIWSASITVCLKGFEAWVWSVYNRK